MAGVEIEWRACVVRTLSYRRRRTNRIDTSSDVNGRRAEVGHNAIQLPSAKYCAGRLTPSCERRELVNHVADEGVASIKIGVTSISVEVERVARRVCERCK